MRALSEYAAELGRARPRKLAPATIGRKLAAVRAFLRHALGHERVPDASFAPRRPRRLPDAPRPHEVDGELEALRRRRPLALRNRALVELVYSAGLRSQEASTSTSPTSTSSRSSSTCAARAARNGSCRSARRRRTRSRVYLPRVAAPARARSRERALPLGARAPPRHEHAAPPAPASAPPAACLRDAPARRRRRPAHDPGAARPQLALDDADVQPRGRAPPAQGLRPLAPALVSR